MPTLSSDPNGPAVRTVLEATRSSSVELGVGMGVGEGEGRG